MNRLSAALLAIGFAASGSVFAQSTYSPSSAGYYGNDGYNGVQQGGAYYDTARVIRVDPVLGGYRGTANGTAQRCYETQSAGGYSRDSNNGYGNGYYGNDGYNRNDPYNRQPYGSGSSTGRNVATVVGGIAGAVLGSKIGGGTGTYAASAIGSMVGGMAGRQVYENTQRDRYTPPGTVRVCEPEPVGNGYSSRTSDGRGTAYDVTYDYNGHRFTRRMDHHPGERVQVRVDVAPQ
ncbi:MAG: glycine zipper 2TM domain-containing protein [Thermomonas sp.]